MLGAHLQTPAAVDQMRRDHLASFAALMVHVDVDRDCEQRIEVAIGLADRFQASLIGAAGCAMWPAFVTGDVSLTKSNQYDFQKLMASFEQRGKKFRAQCRGLDQIEWRSMLDSPNELLVREARERRIS
jgi:hypothetical protein